MTPQSILDMVDRKDDGFVVSEHFTRPDHSKEDLRVQVLEAGTNRSVLSFVTSLVIIITTQDLLGPGWSQGQVDQEATGHRRRG